MNKQYVVICDNRYEKGILFLKNNTKDKTSKSHWTKFRFSAMTFSNYNNAAAIAAQYKYNNTRVAILDNSYKAIF